MLDEVPAISSCFGDNPAYKIFTLAHNTLAPTGYTALNYDFSFMPLQFNNNYTFSTAYSIRGSLGASLLQLYPELATGIPLTSQPANAQQTLYKDQYLSGDNLGVNPKSGELWNPITNANWPVFACGIGKMAQLD